MQIIFLGVFMLILFAIGFFDFKTYIIPNKLVFPLIALGIIYQLLFGSILRLLLGFSVSFIIGFICFLLGGMGGGDVKLMAAIGIWLGFETFIFITLIASAFGAVWSIVDFIKQGKLKDKAAHIVSQFKMVRFIGFKAFNVKNRDLKNPIPFGSCLALASAIAIFIG